jgi:hypothetical protein
MTTMQWLTIDVIRAERFLSLLSRPTWPDTAATVACSLMFGPVTSLLFLQDCTPKGQAPSAPLGDDASLIECRTRDALLPLRQFRPGPPGTRIYELRIYQTRLGEEQAFVDQLLQHLPVREKHSPNSGVWLSRSGEAGRVFHLWGYEDLAHRERVRAALRHDPVWTGYTADILPRLRLLHSLIAQPIGMNSSDS